MSRVGILCNENHVIFSEVAEMLENREVETDFLNPGTKLSKSEISDYGVLVPKKSREAVYHNMKLADEAGIETLNGFLTGMSADHNLASMYHLAENGFQVPKVDLSQRDAEEFIEKPVRECYREEPRILNGHEPRSEGFFLEELINSESTDYKIYIIDDEPTYIEGLETASKLDSADAARESFEPSKVGFGEPEAQRLLSTFYDADFLGIDVIRSREGNHYVVDVNAAPSFRGAEGAPEKLADLIYSRI